MQSGVVVHKNSAVYVPLLGEQPFQLGKKILLCWFHMVGWDCLPRLGGNKDFVKRCQLLLRQGSLVIAPNRHPVHLGGLSFEKFLGILMLRASCFRFCKICGPNGSAIASIWPGHQRWQGQSAAICDDGSKMRGPPWIDLSGAAGSSFGWGTFDVQIVSSSLLTSSSITLFLLLQWISSSATNFSGVIPASSLRSVRPGTWRTVSLWKNKASKASNVVTNA